MPSKLSTPDVFIILLMLTPAGILLAPLTGLSEPGDLNGFEAFMLFVFPIFAGLGLSAWLARKQKKKLAWFCLFFGLFPIGYLFTVLLGIQMRWWGK